MSDNNNKTYIVANVNGAKVTYGSFDDLVQDIIIDAVNNYDWATVAWWGNIMDSGEFDMMPYDQNKACIENHTDIKIEEINVK